MNDGFNLYNRFPKEDSFSFFEELKKRGFRNTNTSIGINPNCYEGTIYDYENDSLVNVKIYKQKSDSSEQVANYIQICKMNNLTNEYECVYRGIKPQSSFAFHLLMSHLFPSKYFVDKYTNGDIYNDEEKNDIDFPPSEKLATLLTIYEFEEKTHEYYPSHFKEIEYNGYNPYSTKRIFKNKNIIVKFDYIRICCSFDNDNNTIFDEYTIKDHELASLLHYALQPASEKKFLKEKLGNDNITSLYVFLKNSELSIYSKKAEEKLKDHLKYIEVMIKGIKRRLNK